MKRKPFIHALLAATIIACDSPTEAVKKNEDPVNQNGFNASTSVFEGTWTWIETIGDVEGVQYRKDSVTEGYSLRYKFFDTEGQGGKLMTIKSNETDLIYLYEYTNSQLVNNSLHKKITLDKMANSAPEIYYWEVTIEKVNNDYVSHLYLRNAEYFTDDCCNGKLEYHFVLTEVPTL